MGQLLHFNYYVLDGTTHQEGHVAHFQSVDGRRYHAKLVLDGDGDDLTEIKEGTAVELE